MATDTASTRTDDRSTGTGVGRAWPLLTGERAHYELAAGNRARAETLLAALEAFGSDGHLIPEQVWDAADIPERELFHSRPSGSAMPLAWAHAEHVKLLRSLADGRVFDMPPQPKERYQIQHVRPLRSIWRFNNKCRCLSAGRVLRVELLRIASVHWSVDGWRTAQDTPTKDSGLGIHFADLDTASLKPGGAIVFTLYWHAEDRWEGVDYDIAVE
jgi:glucoamylase